MLFERFFQTIPGSQFLQVIKFRLSIVETSVQPTMFPPPVSILFISFLQFFNLGKSIFWVSIKIMMFF